MAEYLLSFNQQWVGDHTEEWFRARGPLAREVVDEMKAAGVYVFAGGLEEEDGPVYTADPTSGSLLLTDGPYVETKEFLGGFAVVRVAGRAGSRRRAAGPMRYAASNRSLRPRDDVGLGPARSRWWRAGLPGGKRGCTVTAVWSWIGSW